MSNDERGRNPRRHPRRFDAAIYLILFAFFLLGAIPGSAQDVTPERIVHAAKEPQNWLTFYGNYRAWSYSPLNQITRENVHRLTPAWTFPTGGRGGLESAPIVADGKLYLVDRYDGLEILESQV